MRNLLQFKTTFAWYYILKFSIPKNVRMMLIKMFLNDTDNINVIDNEHRRLNVDKQKPEL